jgi:hypothetical protein
VFTPKPDAAYWLWIDSPVGIEKTHRLPAVEQKGVVLHLPQAVAEDEIDVRLQTVGEPRELLVGAYCRGRMVDFVKAPKGESSKVKLKPMPGIGGVYRITVFEKASANQETKFRPVAERLIYRKSAAKVEVAVNADRAGYRGGDAAFLSLSARNEKDSSVATMATVAVVDTSFLKWGKVKTESGLPTHFLLLTEVHNPEDLENADVLLSNHPKAGVALDLLLGCQGWRRFAEQDPLEFQKQQKLANGRLANTGNAQQQNPNFLANSAKVPQVLDLEKKELDELDEGYAKKAIQLEKGLAKAENLRGGSPELMQTMYSKEAAVAAYENESLQLREGLRRFKGFLYQIGFGLGVLALVALSFFCLSVGLRRLCDASGNDRGWLGSGLALLGLLFLISLVGTFYLRGVSLIDDERFIGGPRNMGFAPMPPPMANNLGAPAAVPSLQILDDRALVEAQTGKGAVPTNDGSKGVTGMVTQDAMKFDDMKRFQPPLPPVVDDPEKAERDLRQQGNYQALLQKHMGRRVQLPPVEDSSVVRVYARQNKTNIDTGPREIAETLYWHPVLLMPDGKADLSFDLPPAVTRFQVVILSLTTDGRLGANQVEFAFDTKAKELRAK